MPHYSASCCLECWAPGEAAAKPSPMSEEIPSGAPRVSSSGHGQTIVRSHRKWRRLWFCRRRRLCCRRRHLIFGRFSLLDSAESQIGSDLNRVMILERGTSRLRLAVPPKLFYFYDVRRHRLLRKKVEGAVSAAAPSSREYCYSAYLA